MYLEFIDLSLQGKVAERDQIECIDVASKIHSYSSCKEDLQGRITKRDQLECIGVVPRFH